MFWIFQQLHLGPIIDPVISGHASSVACPGIHLDYLWRCLGCMNLMDVYLYWWFVRGGLTDSSLTGRGPLLGSTELNEWSSTVKLSYGILKSSVRKFIDTPLEHGTFVWHPNVQISYYYNNPSYQPSSQCDQGMNTWNWIEKYLTYNKEKNLLSLYFILTLSTIRRMLLRFGGKVGGLGMFLRQIW